LVATLSRILELLELVTRVLIDWDVLAVVEVAQPIDLFKHPSLVVPVFSVTVNSVDLLRHRVDIVEQRTRVSEARKRIGITF